MEGEEEQRSYQRRSLDDAHPMRPALSSSVASVRNMMINRHILTAAMPEQQQPGMKRTHSVGAADTALCRALGPVQGTGKGPLCRSWEHLRTVSLCRCQAGAASAFVTRGEATRRCVLCSSRRRLG